MLSRTCGQQAIRAASAAASARGAAQESITRLPSGLTVASVDLNGASSHLVVAFRAGSRYEKETGTVHVVRDSVGRDSERFFGQTLVWNTAANGGQLSAGTNRDVFAVQIGVSRDNAPVAVSLLGQLAANAFKPWDIEDVKDLIKSDSQAKDAFNVVLEDLHRAAYRNGPLGKSVYTSKGKVPGWKSVQEFAKQYLVPGNAVLVGVNVDHSTLLDYAQQFPFEGGNSASPAESKYFGGDYRREGSGSQTFVAVAGQGAALTSPKDVAVQTVVAQLFRSAARSAGVHAKVVNANYADSGLVGVRFAVPSKDVASRVKAAITALKNVKVDETSVKNARARASLKVLRKSEKASNVALDQAIQILTTGNTVSPSEFASAINAVSVDDVSKALSRATSKLSLAGYGNVSELPYLDEL